MVELCVCVGTACHLKGSKELIEEFENIIDSCALSEKVKLTGKFCLGHCADKSGVSVTVDGQFLTVKPENARDFFENEIIGRLL